MNNPEPYQWIISGDCEKKLQIMQEITEAIENLPETSLTFSPRSLLNQRHQEKVVGGYQDFMDKFVRYNGFWVMPDNHHGKKSRNRYVNPHHPESYKLADGYVECECGTYIIHEHERHANLPGFNEHTDDCKVEWKFQAKSDLWSKRREIIEESGYMKVPLETVATRLGVSERTVVQKMTQRLDIEYQSLNRESTVKKHLTWLYLADEGFSYTEIADAFGIARNTISGAKRLLKEKEIRPPWRNQPAQKPDFIASDD